MRQGGGGAAASGVGGGSRPMAPWLTAAIAHGTAADERSTVTCRRPDNGEQRYNRNDDDNATGATSSAPRFLTSLFCL